MGTPVLILGKSGSGKSTSLRNFKSDEVYFINIQNKPLPFKGKFESTLATDDYATVAKGCARSQKNTIVIDDAGYLITNHFMRGHGAAKGNAIFNFYNELADKYWTLIEFVIRELPPEKVVYFIMHEEENELGNVKPKTMGKMLDEKVCLEGMFTIVLRCMTEDGKHIFRTNTDGLDVTKSPIGMFEQETMDNDLKAVDQIIRDYYELGGNNE